MTHHEPGGKRSDPRLRVFCWAPKKGKSNDGKGPSEASTQGSYSEERETFATATPGHCPDRGEGSLVEMMTVEQEIAQATPAEAARLLGLLLVRLVTPTQTTEPKEPEQADDLLTPAEVAALLKVKPSQVHRIAALRPHRRALGRKTIRYARAGVMRVAQSRAA